MTSPIQFDSEAHTYRLNGLDVPGVTTVLKDLSAREYRFVDPKLMADAAWLGQAVHKLIELDLEGTLDETALDDRLSPYLQAWRNFRAASGFVAYLSEARVYSKKYGYAGTLDLFGVLNGEAALIDAKRTAAVPRTAGPQTAAYEIALRECQPEVVARAVSGPGAGRIRRFALHLMPDHKWRLVPFPSPNDARVFLSALTLSQWSNAA